MSGVLDKHYETLRALCALPVDMRDKTFQQLAEYHRDEINRASNGLHPRPIAEPQPTSVDGETRMSRFRKLPVEVEAMQYRVEDGMDNVRALTRWGVSFYGERPVATGAMKFWNAKSSTWCFVRPGDWIIKERDGHGFYPCTAAEFSTAYEPVA